MIKSICDKCQHNYGIGKTTDNFIAHCYLLYEEKKIEHIKKGNNIAVNLLNESRIQSTSDIPNGCPYTLEHTIS